MPPDHALLLSTVLVFLGLLGMLVRRSLLAVLMSLHVMIGGIVLALVAYTGRGEPGASAASFAAIVSIVAILELAVGVALVVAFFRNRGSTAIERAGLLRW
ncbi:MAG: NADH-quinone oxidoreductase subunit NuoK [Myxococcales bacterium]|nr:NADH-quinone oxidoreductase subunit NuoK [Myxococcales bacterium]